MITCLTTRVTALGLAALLTFATLGSIDFLATSEPANAVMAAAAASRA